MIAKSSVKVQKSFKVEFTLTESEMSSLCLLLSAGVAKTIRDKDNYFLNDDDKNFMRSVRDYIINLRDNADRHGYAD